MKKLVSLSLLIMITIISSPSYADYCTSKNWETATNYFRKHEERLISSLSVKQQIDASHLLRKHLSTFNIYSTDELVERWGKIPEFFNNSYEILTELLDSISSEVGEMEFLEAKFTTSYKLWKKLADYCYDEADYGNHKLAIENSELPAERLKQVKELHKELSLMREHYIKIVKHFRKAKKSYEKSLKSQQN